jgi:hypothetical protein
MSITASATIYFLYEHPGLPDSPRAWADASAYIGGSAFAYFLLAFIAAWIPGLAGAIVGTIIVAVLSYWGGVGAYQRHRAERELLSSLEKHSQEMNDSARKQLEQMGRVDTDPSKFRSMIDDMIEKSRDLDPQTKSAVEGMAVVMQRLLKPAEDARPLGLEIATVQFQDPSSIEAVTEIDERLTKLQKFRASAQKLLSMYPNFDLMLKTELAQRNLPPLVIKDCAENAIKAAHLEIATPLAQSNVDYADLLIERFWLLKSQFGHWFVENNVVYFVDNQALQQWNDSSRQLFKIAEERETLELRLAAAQRSN